MKLEQEPIFKDRQQVVAEKAPQYRHDGSERRIRGLVVWEYDLTTGELSKADIDRKVEIGIDKRPIYQTSVVRKRLCLYVQALNQDNAMKKVRRLLRDKRYNVKSLITQ